MNIPCDPGIVEQLRNTGQLQGISSTEGYSFNIDLSAPHIALAIHAGHNVRKELLPFMQISESARFFEEDPATDMMILNCKSSICALDSRAEYDLNRPEELAIPLTPERFWGVQVFASQPTDQMNCETIEKYNSFYRFMGSCITVLLERFGACIIYDMHSYNISRQVEKGIDTPPVFNLGTELLDKKRWGKEIDGWLDRLSQISIPGIPTTVAENMVFKGKGELCRRLSSWDKNILILPTEISKIFMNEHEGNIYPEITKALKNGLEKAISDHSFQSIKS
jgi:hypothetical protein